jgi:hypothetical protein
VSTVVFILGAGASQQCGAPLMANFLDVANDLLRTKQVEDKRQQFDRVFNVIGSLQSVHSKAQLDITNIESVFNALELGRIIQRVPGIDTAEIPSVIASLKELIVKTLETTIDFPADRSYINAPRPYQEFASLIKYLRSEASPVQSVSVITFNYDIAADMALHRAGFGPDYVIEKDPRSQDQVRLLKLHGSLNWATEKATKKIRTLHLFDYLQKYTIQSFGEQHSEIKVPIGSQLSEYFLNFAKPFTQVDPEPVIVPPSWNKADYHQALSDVWAAAADELSKAEYIFIIGYSLPETDSFFRHLYALGSVGKSALRKIIVYNPENHGGGVDTRFRSLLGPGAIARYDYGNMTFEKAISDIKYKFPRRK